MTTNPNLVYVEFPNRKGIERRYRGCPAPVVIDQCRFYVDGRRLSGATERHARRYVRDQVRKRDAAAFRRLVAEDAGGDVWGLPSIGF